MDYTLGNLVEKQSNTKQTKHTHLLSSLKSEKKAYVYPVSDFPRENWSQERKRKIKIWTDLLDSSKLFYLFGA